MVQEVGRRSSTAEARFRSQTNVRGVCVWQIGGGTVLSPCSETFRCQYYATMFHNCI